MYFRHYRHNPLFSNNPTVTDITDDCLLDVTYFDSVLKARAFLKQAECLNSKQLSDPKLQKKVEAAHKVIAKADRRNERRRNRRAAKAGKAPPVASGLQALQKYTVRTCDEAKKTVGRLCEGVTCETKKGNLPAETGTPSWEEVTGPKGEVVRYKVKYYTDGPSKGQVRERNRVVKEQPKAGDIILDLTSGVKAWKVSANGRRQEIAVTKQMEALYKESNLYKVRQLAAGHISLNQFFEAVKGKVTAAKRSMKRKKNK